MPWTGRGRAHRARTPGAVYAEKTFIRERYYVPYGLPRCEECRGRGLVRVAGVHRYRRTGHVVVSRATECMMCNGTGIGPLQEAR